MMGLFVLLTVIPQFGTSSTPVRDYSLEEQRNLKILKCLRENLGQNPDLEFSESLGQLLSDLLTEEKQSKEFNKSFLIELKKNVRLKESYEGSNLIFFESHIRLVRKYFFIRLFENSPQLHYYWESLRYNAPESFFTPIDECLPRNFFRPIIEFYLYQIKCMILFSFQSALTMETCENEEYNESISNYFKNTLKSGLKLEEFVKYMQNIQYENRGKYISVVRLERAVKSIDTIFSDLQNHCKLVYPGSDAKQLA